jgi:aminoglycoside phosphotransferase (APT) family kinase protein
MHADEIEIDVSLASRLIAGQFPHWAGLPIEQVHSAGTDNAIFRLGGAMAIRLPRRPGADGQVKKEHQWLPRLAPLLPLAAPVPIEMGMPAEGYPYHWSVCHWLNGENALTEPIVDLRRAAIELSQFIAALQQIDTSGGPQPGPHNSFRGVPLVTRDAQTRAAISSLDGIIDRVSQLAHGKDPLVHHYGTVRQSGFMEIFIRGICWLKRVGSVP